MRLIDIEDVSLLKTVTAGGLSAKALWRRINAQTTVNAEPVRHGTWIRTGRKNIYGGCELECSECGDKVMIQHIEDELYCRHCGAKMDGERKEE